MKYKKVEGLFNIEQQKEITGTLRSIRENVNISGYDYKKVYVIETEDGIWTLAGATVLDSMIENCNVIHEGTKIKIKYLGKKGDKEYKTYEVFVGVED